jgi:hypothetical protein
MRSVSRLLSVLFTAALIVGVFPQLASAASNPGSSFSQCVYGGFEKYVNEKGDAFGSVGQCLEFVSKGGVLRPPHSGAYVASFYVRNDATSKLLFRITPMFTYCARNPTSGEFTVESGQKLKLDTEVIQGGSCHTAQTETKWVIEVENFAITPVAFLIRERITPGWSTRCWASIPLQCSVSSDGINSFLSFR